MILVVLFLSSFLLAYKQATSDFAEQHLRGSVYDDSEQPEHRRKLFLFESHMAPMSAQGGDDAIEDLMSEYAEFDRNDDGDPAIKLHLASFEQNHRRLGGDGPINYNGRFALVLVESRLVQSGGPHDPTSRLERLKADLRAEGLFSFFIEADLYNGPRHQDGRTLLAIRSFLKAMKNFLPNLEGVLLIGSFPEATVVRRTVWAPSFPIIIGGVSYTDTNYLAIEPEYIAARSEIVLSDLDGKWENLYHEDLFEIESIQALPDDVTAAIDWPVDGAVFSSTAFNRFTVTYRDFFFVSDANYHHVGSTNQHLRVEVHHLQLHPEVSDADRTLPNPIARPEIIVSRINARNIAINPKSSIVGDDGNTPLAEDGKPQTFESSTYFNTGTDFFSQDVELELQLICDHLDRNHRHRTGSFGDLPFRAAGIGYELSGSGAANYLAPVSDNFAPALVKNDATLLDYVRWLKEPAVMRAYNAHSNAFNSVFGSNYDVSSLEQEVGGRPFRWKWDGDTTYQPSLEDQGGLADFYVHRTLWQNGELEGAGPSLIVHLGCEVNVPAGTQTTQHYVEGYADLQNAEGLLFYANGLAMIARAKVFNDSPTGFPEALNENPRARFGDGWTAFYENDAADANLGTYGLAIRAKKAYFWSLLGDWTLRPRYKGGLGILASTPDLESQAVHATEAWIDGWNFDANVNDVQGIADMDGDGHLELIVTSAWGIGILHHDGSRWRALLVEPRDTWFGGWRYNATVNAGYDQIQGFGDVAGSGTDQIVITSSWGIGVLQWNGSTLTAPVAKSNGSRFGGWLLNTADNTIVGIGDVDGLADGREEVVVTSPWGIGILGISSSGDSFDSLMLEPNGVRFGDWLLNTADNTIHGLYDFDGDGHKEILISSPWGIGILKFLPPSGSLTSVAMHANGSNLNGFIVDTTSAVIAAVGDIAGDGEERLVMMDASGVHVLRLGSGSLTREAIWEQGVRSNGWLLNTADNWFGPVGDLDGDGSNEIVIRSPWGVGVVAYDIESGLFCQTLHPNGSRLGDWILNASNKLIGAGNLVGTSDDRMELLIQA